MKTQEAEVLDTFEIDGKEYTQEEVVYSNHLERHIPLDVAMCVIGIDDDDDWIIQDETDEFVWAEDEGKYMHENLGFYCNLENACYYDTDNMTRSYCGEEGHEENFSEHDYWYYIERGQADGYYVHCDDAVYCEDIGEYVHCDEAHWSEEDECSYWDEDNMNQNSDEHIKSYHSNKSPYDYNRGFVKSPFSVGFEIEKKSFINHDGDEASDRGDFVGDFEFFEGFETDSSCGVEGVSNIMPLSPPRSKHRKKVFEMIDDAECIINSPSNKNCGGHITVSYKDTSLDGYELVNKMRDHLALMYALYRFRLSRSYCARNKSAKKEDNTKYSPINVKGNRVEFRLPSQVKNTKQLKLRYDLVYLTMHHSLVEPVNFNVFLNKARGIVKQMYNGNEDKVNNIFKLAQDFRRYLSAEDVSENINEFINPNND
jgi:hypothetical protein